MVRVRAAIGTLALCALLGACSSAGAEPQGLTASPTTKSTPTATPSPTATELTTHDLSDAKLGIVFVDTPNLTGPAASAHDAVAIFEREYWRSLTTGKVSPIITTTALSGMQGLVENSVRLNKKNGYGMGGVLHVSISNVTQDTKTATAAVCEDGAEVAYTVPGKSTTVTYKEAGIARKNQATMTLISDDGGKTWAPQSFGKTTAGC